MDITLDSIKNIHLYQKKNGYRFTIDSILLAEFVNRIKPNHIADIGAGNGVIGILLSKKYPNARIALIEIQDSLFALAKRNIDINNLGERIEAYKFDIQDMEQEGFFPPHVFDIVVSNPPFRRLKSGKINPNDEKAIARHEIRMNIEKLVKIADYLLKPKGYLYLIFHPERLVELFDSMRNSNIEPKRLRFVHPNPECEAHMVLIEGVKNARSSVKIDRPLVIYNTKGIFSREVQKILSCSNGNDD